MNPRERTLPARLFTTVCTARCNCGAWSKCGIPDDLERSVEEGRGSEIELEDRAGDEALE